MTTEIDICNKAILRIGGNMISATSGLVADLDDSSLEAKLCKLNYALIRDVVTEDRVWSFAIKRALLDTPEITPPLFGFDQQFAKPSDALNIWRVSYDQYAASYDGTESDVQGDWRVEGDYILANSDTIRVEYVRRMDLTDDINLFTPQFIDSFSLRLAAEICVPISENAGLFKALAAEYEKRKMDAYAINGSQAKHERFSSTQLTRAR
jgi:hypothetical protein